MKKEYDFSLEPGKKKESNRNYKDKNPVISVVIPFYNDKDYIKQSVNSILNQTFPYYEILIIDDGSKDESSLEKLKEVETSDKRIKVFHKENEGLSATRDYGASQSSKTCKYIMFLDSDDLLEPTYLECAYWTLETNEKASWAYSDSVGFDAEQYTWNKWFDSEKLKKENELVSAALVRKSDFLDVGGYELREKAVNEDWNFWLKLIAKGKYPVHMSYYGQWYRRKKTGELKKSKDNKDRALEIIKETASRVTKKVEAIQYPKQDYNYDLLLDKVETILQPEPLAEKSEKINLLFIVPWLITGGADRFNLNLVKGLDKEKYNIIVLTTEPNQNTLRQEFEKYAIVYDLTSFLNQKFWLAFVNYIIKKENISVILNSNSKFGYSILPYLKANNINIPIIDYVHMEEWYNRNGGYSRYSTMLESVIDETLVCNENSKKVLCNYFKRNEKEIKTVYIGVDEEEFNPEKYNKEEILKKYNIEKNKKYIFSYICRISEQKRPMLLLEIIKKLKEKRNDFKVLVVGDGNLLPKMKTRANNLGLDENIIFLGNIENTEEIYKISDLTINCSIKEGLALTSYESLSMGIPVISSDVGGQKELINEDVGIIVPCMQNEKDIYSENYEEEEILVYIQAIEEVLSNLENYKSKCRQRILNKFTIRNMIKEMSKILEEIKTNSNADKIKNGKNLLNNLNITKELITLNMMNDKAEYNWECTEYEKRAYGRAYSIKGLNYKHELLKERLWKIPLWRGFVKVVHKVKGN
ncbi:MAG TPA: glycosyltransferase [Clostridiaceae bacterium]|nr:glycosyltransferase [Clostridiaceae bacterium]